MNFFFSFNFADLIILSASLFHKFFLPVTLFLKVTLIGDSKDMSMDAVIASAPVTSRQNRPKSVPVHLHRQPDMVRNLKIKQNFMVK